ncbi:MAG: hypothetical protein K8S94_08800 [Planctomycetia bacterium]|nr:hypothetical protein [Planctomycetia bacterium]
MVATNEGQRKAGSRKTKREQPATAAGGDAPPVSQTAAPTTRPSRPRGPVAEPIAVSARKAARWIKQLADVGDTLDGRNRLRKLAAQVRKDGGDAQRMAFVEVAIGECLDEASRAASPLERWLSCEAATWALAWMARTKRAGGSAGSLLERLVGQARAAQALLATGDTLPARFVLCLSRLFRDIEACRCLEEGASATLAAEIERLVSDRGVVNVTGSAAMIERVVRWTAAREVARATGGGAWGEATERRWKAAATTAVRLLGGRGRLVAGAGQMPDCFTAALLDAVTEMGGRRDRTVRELRRGRADTGRRDVLSRDLHDAAAAVAIIRTGWDRRSLRVMLDYRHAVPRLEIAVADRLLVEGAWQWEAWAGGRALEAEGPWTVSCWESDRKATFLEITAPLSGGRQLERQVVVLPRDRIVVLADAVTTPAGVAAPAEVRYRGVVPLAGSLEGDAAAENREIVVFDTATRFLALPLALPEWRSAGRGGFESSEAGLVLSQEGVGGRLYAPLWLDCDPTRIGQPLTWRQLTVADTRLNLPPHQATGYRIQSGHDQWLLYRSLDAARNRTLLGCNVSCEFLLGRIKKSGEVARTLEIQ